MKTLGLDIGTTTVSAAVFENGRVLDSRTLKNDSFLKDRDCWEKVQDPAYILTTAQKAVLELTSLHPDIAGIGLTGQQHGIVYLDCAGCPVSPLYTWQDGRGSLEYENGETYAGYLRRITGYENLATGYGLVTHFYNLKNGLVPENAVVFCTIHDYVAMKLAGLSAPLTEPTDAASFGLFDVEHGDYDYAAIENAGIDTALLPKLAPQRILGTGALGIPVCAAIGDNQASFLGATGGKPGSLLVNMGTGGQFSAHTARYLTCPGLETRPFPLGGWLLVGASLCGGRAYALLEGFFRKVVEMQTGTAPENCYEAMRRMVEENALPNDLPLVSPLFQGTRLDPDLRGRIENLSTDNFTPLHLTCGLLQGMAGELHDMYRRYLDAGGSTGTLFGSGNGLRKNPALCAAFERLFGQPLTLSSMQEEAACGAAQFAAGALEPAYEPV